MALYGYNLELRIDIDVTDTVTLGETLAAHD